MKRAMLFTLVLMTGFSSALYGAPSACPANFLAGQAPDLVNPRLASRASGLCFSEFAVLDSGLTRTPLYSADHLTAARVAEAERQKRGDAAQSFHEEARLPVDERSTLADYARSGYDRGHLEYPV